MSDVCTACTLLVQSPHQPSSGCVGNTASPPCPRDVQFARPHVVFCPDFETVSSRLQPPISSMHELRFAIPSTAHLICCFFVSAFLIRSRRGCAVVVYFSRSGRLPFALLMSAFFVVRFATVHMYSLDNMHLLRGCVSRSVPRGRSHLSASKNQTVLSGADMLLYDDERVHICESGCSTHRYC